MKTYDQWTQVQHDLGVIELLQLIRTTMYSSTATNNSTLTYIKAEVGLLTCNQTKQLSNSKYLETFRNQVEVYILFGDDPEQVFLELTAGSKSTLLILITLLMRNDYSQPHRYGRSTWTFYS